MPESPEPVDDRVLLVHLRQQTSDDVRTNEEIFAIAVTNIFVETAVVTPFFVFISHVVWPAFAARMLRDALTSPQRGSRAA